MALSRRDAPADGIRAARHRGEEFHPLLLAVLYFLTAAVAIELWRVPGTVAGIWVANAVALSFFLRSDRSRWPLLLFAVFAGAFAANLGSGHALPLSFAYTIANVGEVGFAAWMLDRWVGPVGLDNIGVRDYLKLQTIAAVVAPGISGLVAASAAQAFLGAPGLDAWWIWWSGSAIGASVVLPLALTAETAAAREQFKPSRLPLFIGLALVTILVTDIAVTWLSHPFVVVALCFLLVALTLSPFGAALILSLSVLVVIVAASLGQVASFSTPVVVPDAAINFFGALALFPSFCVSLIVAELRREQIRIAESERRFRNAMEHSAIGMAMIGLDGRWLSTNRSLSDMLGYTPEEFAALTFQDITHPDDLSADLDLLRRTLAGEIDTYRMEKRYIRKNGSVAWGHLAVSLIRDEETGAPLHFVSQIEDITARRLAEAAVEEAESRWSFALESAGQGVWDHRVKTNTAFYSPVWKSMIGYREDELGNSGDLWTTLIHPDDFDRVMRVNDDYLAGRTEFFEAEFRMRHKDGHYIWILDRGKVIERDADGTPVRMIGIHTDITRQKATEAALAASDSRWSFALEGARQGVWDYDVTAGKTFYSSVWKSILGYREEEVDDDAQAWWDYVHPDDVAAARAAGREHVANNTPYFECEFRMRHKDGRWVWILDRGKVIERDAAGRPVRMIGTHTDITRRKETEEQVKHLSQRIRMAVDAGGIGIWERDIASKDLWWDKEMYRIYEIDPKAPGKLYDLWASRLHPDDRDRVESEIAAAVALRKGYDVEFRIRRASGEIRHVHSVAKLVTRSDGSPWILSGINWDTTDSRLLTDALAREKELLRVTLQSIGDAVIATDVDANITFMNTVAEELTGYPEREALGRKVSEVVRLVDETTLAPVLDQISECIRRGESISRQGTTMLVSRDGERRDIRESAAPVRAESDEIVGAVIVFQDMTQARQLQRQLAHSASHDALTGLPNRMAFDTELASACVSASGEGREHALCFIDLDRFKIVNDTVGHAAGDALLGEIGRVIQHTVRSYDFTARLGGDEFALLLRDCPVHQAELVARNVIVAIEAIPFSWAGRVYDVGASIGLTAITAESPPPSDLLSQADVACYTAKAMGRNRVAVYQSSESDAQRHHRDLQVAANLRGALEENRFRLFAQEIRGLDPRSKPGSHAELLLRLEDNGQLLDPGAFIPAAERFDLMANIDRWVVRTALRTYGARLHARRDLTLSINLSANSLNDPLFWSFIEGELRAARFPAERIHLEITETALINNMNAAHALVSAARQAGCSVVLDDFGTGLSSFAYLKQFPVDYVKIDGSFMNGLKENGVDRAIVESINAMVHKIGARTVAECVEDAETIEILKAIGVDAVQGFAIARPVPLDEFLAPLKKASAA